MGATCSCTDSVEKGSEFSIEQDEIKRRMQEEGFSFDDSTLKLLLEKTHLIVRVQAFFRGYRVRRRMRSNFTHKTRAPRPFLKSYASNETSTVIGTNHF
jgi:hypothetical protein